MGASARTHPAMRASIALHSCLLRGGRVNVRRDPGPIRLVIPQDEGKVVRRDHIAVEGTRGAISTNNLAMLPRSGGRNEGRYVGTVGCVGFGHPAWSWHSHRGRNPRFVPSRTAGRRCRQPEPPSFTDIRLRGRHPDTPDPGASPRRLRRILRLVDDGAVSGEQDATRSTLTYVRTA